MICLGDMAAQLKATNMRPPVLAVGGPSPSVSIHSPVPSAQLCNAGEPLTQGYQPTPSSDVSLAGEMTELDAHTSVHFCSPAVCWEPGLSLRLPSGLPRPEDREHWGLRSKQQEERRVPPPRV